MAKQRLGEFLISRGILSQEKLAEALRLHRVLKKRLGEVLVDQGYLREEQLTALLGEFFGMEVFSEKDVELTPELAALVPGPVARRNNIVPVAQRGNELLVACAEPVPRAVLENLGRISGRQVRPVLMGFSALAALLYRAYGQGNEQLSAAARDVVPESPDYAVKILERIIVTAVAQRASDLHLEPDSGGLRVRMRVDGKLRTLEVLPAAVMPLVISRIKILGNMNIAEKRAPQDGGFLFKQEDGPGTNIRISTMPCAGGEKAVLRLFSPYDRSLELENLGMEKDLLAQFKKTIQLPHGLILVTGPTGSGKTFTLYSALKSLRSDSVNIITIEDPIEFQMDGITQVQVDETSKKMTFSSALRSVLRQDPDVIMVGEMRDGETARLALQAALTGHIVLSTLHTNDAVSAVDRLIDMGCEPYLVSSALRGVLAQRLVRVICPRCRVEYVPSPAELELLGLPPHRKEVFYTGRGCSYCRDEGYRGRTGIYEFLEINRDIQKLIAKGRDSTAIRESVRGTMRTLREDGIIKLRRGVAGITDIYRVTMEI
ncbi:type IV pilus assembly protein PilB [Desulfohalotomaculum tongense]|uniref:GspE/PulE family protein n=1 Tax=Desulforadius tongensis TaxID=1216062 RepID=UPI00195DC5D4|nr:GspE/PulE family protein [Desulforadius tongensis]MBM7854497.1 type IV pilus assembly protein PilB [Desulforadius tongensis]